MANNTTGVTLLSCIRCEREVKSRQVGEEKAKTEMRRDGFA